MKNIQTILTGIAIMLLFSFSQCKKNKNEEAQLPPETNTGANTFGCRISGQVFLPRNGRSLISNKIGFTFRFLNLSGSTGVNFGFVVTDWRASPLQYLILEADSIPITAGTTYLFKNQTGNPRAGFYNGGVSYIVLDNDGTLTVTKYDEANRVFSGFFSFMGTNTTTGEKINITEGRFDIRY
jgi:hypothetical protein